LKDNERKTLFWTIDPDFSDLAWNDSAKDGDDAWTQRDASRINDPAI
jgi:hypothetical protein